MAEAQFFFQSKTTNIGFEDLRIGNPGMGALIDVLFVKEV
jgi:hypothetical protein